MSASGGSGEAEVICSGGRGLTSPVVDADGRLFVASSGTGAILTVAPDGRGLTEWATTSGQPAGLAFDARGQLLVADLAHGAVLTVGEDGSKEVLVREYEGDAFKGVSAIAFDSKGSMYFTDSGPFGETTLESPKGSVFCVSASAPQRILRPIVMGALANPCGIAVGSPESVIYVTEMMTNRVLRLTPRPSGIFHCSVFHQFSGRMGPSAIAVDRASGAIFVARYDFASVADRGVVSELSPDGEVVREYEVPGPEVTGLCVEPDGGGLLVTEASTNTVYRIPL